MNEIILKKAKGIASITILIGILLYLSKFLRVYFAGNQAVLFVLGFLPNLGLSMVIPFIYVSNRLRQRKQLKHFTIACVISFLLMVLNEIRDVYQTGRVFDWLDIFASLAGVFVAWQIYQFSLKKMFDSTQNFV